MQSEKYRLYDPKHNGGLWIGRDYSGGPVWKRDPLYNISHGAAAMQAARFYYLAVTGRLVAEQYFADFAEIMSNPGIRHKFVKGIKKSNPDAEIYRIRHLERVSCRQRCHRRQRERVSVHHRGTDGAFKGRRWPGALCGGGGRNHGQHVQVIEMKKTNRPAGRDRNGETEN